MRRNTTLLCLLVATLAWSVQPQEPNAQKSDIATPKTAEQAFKNIQVLKGVPADQIIPAMQFITASLGVQCDFCHLEKAFEKDDKEAKGTARKMMRMMFAINKDNFDGHQEVTCYACHRGARKPVIVPTILADENTTVAPPSNEMNGTAPLPNATPLPNAQQIVDRYLQAIGGKEAVSRVSTRVQNGTLTVGTKQFPVEVVAKAPTKRAVTVHFSGGDSVTTINDEKGWLGATGKTLHTMSPSELDASKIEAESFFPAQLKQSFKELRAERKETVSGKVLYVVSGIREAEPPVELYFDEESGLLVRLRHYTATPLGLNPTQIDYADYRSEGPVKTPFRWTISRPNGRFTIQIEQMQQDVPIPDDKFSIPTTDQRSRGN
jgi:photosynthetic reaction center cytochrome c subunit